jgi:hypothetical protein
MQICISSGSPALKPLVNERKINFKFSEILGMMRRVARWFVLKNPNLGKFWRSTDRKMFFCILWRFDIFYDHLVHFVLMCYIFSRFGIMYQEKSGSPELMRRTRSRPVGEGPPPDISLMAATSIGRQSTGPQIKLLLLPYRVARFFFIRQSDGKYVYQITTNLPNSYKIYQMAKEYTDFFSFQGPLKFTQIKIFCLKTYHLATLVP